MLSVPWPRDEQLLRFVCRSKATFCTRKRNLKEMLFIPSYTRKNFNLDVRKHRKLMSEDCERLDSKQNSAKRVSTYILQHITIQSACHQSHLNTFPGMLQIERKENLLLEFTFYLSVFSLWVQILLQAINSIDEVSPCLQNYLKRYNDEFSGEGLDLMISSHVMFHVVRLHRILSYKNR